MFPVFASTRNVQHFCWKVRECDYNQRRCEVCPEGVERTGVRRSFRLRDNSQSIWQLDCLLKTYDVKVWMKLSDKPANIFIYSAGLNRNYIYDSGSVRGHHSTRRERENGSFLRGPRQGARPRHKSERQHERNP